MQCAARILAELDVLAALADVAAREGYVRPTITDGFDLEIVAGRHPVVERMMPREKFIPNDVRLTDDARLDHPHGPEHGGEEHDPAAGGADRAAGAGRELRAGVGAPRSASCDRVFTRVGASDNLVRGQSTFMVEMAETSAILHTRDAPQPRAAGRDRPWHVARTTACRSRGR